MKKVFFGGCIIAVILCSCSSKMTDENSEIQTTTSFQTTIYNESDATTSSDLTSPTADATGFSKCTYNTYYDTISAETIYNTDIIIMPDTINGYNYSLCGVKDDKIVIQINNYDEGTYSEFGLFATDDSSYEKIVSASEELFYVCSRKNEYVFEKFSDDVCSLMYYNSESSEFKTMMFLTDGKSTTERAVTFFNDNILFEIHTPEDVSIYEYDINSGNTHIYLNNAMRPSVNGDYLKYIHINPNTNICDKIVDCHDNSEFQIKNDNLCDLICTRDSVFGITVTYDESYSESHNDPYTNYFMEVIEVKDDANYDAIISTHLGDGELIEGICHNSFCVGWFDWTGRHSSPCVYDMNEKKIVLFDCLEDCSYSTYLGDDINVIYDKTNFQTDHKVCIFKQK